jgi:predicted transcriptional regulator
VERLRKEYSREDKELIEKCLEAKRIFNLKLESLVQELEEKGQLIS